MELLQYLDMEQSWLNTVEEKVQATDNLPESTEAVNEALEVHNTQTHSLSVITLNASYLSSFFPVNSLTLLRQRSVSGDY